ncbi:MAG: response regulator transcription factor [Candidatus Nanopelagicales bacterium]
MSVDSRPIRVAVLDDHPLVREGLAALLAVPHTVSAPFGVDVITVGEDLEGALEAHPDVVLLDIVMEDDVPIVHKVRRCLDRGAEVLLMSATAPPSKILSGLRAGALGFLPKTASVDEVRTAVADVARGEVHLTVDLLQYSPPIPSDPISVRRNSRRCACTPPEARSRRLRARWRFRRTRSRSTSIASVRSTPPLVGKHGRGRSCTSPLIVMDSWTAWTHSATSGSG